MMTVSLIITTYNWPQALDCCLRSVMRQHMLPDEILIADDGSTDETRQLIAHYQQTAPVPVRHIWQEDEGFRLAKIRNKAIAASRCDYIIQIDGDLILHPNFVKDHVSHARRGYFTAGSRGRILPKLVSEVLESREFHPSIFKTGVSSRMNMLHIHYAAELYRRYGPKRFVKGCNMSFWRADLLQINGYDESFVGWGAEDDDIAHRLINSGVKQQNLKFAAVVYHIAHGQHDRENTDSNKSQSLSSLVNKLQRCKVGVDQYLTHA